MPISDQTPKNKSKNTNRTGIPNNLKSNVENASGISMDDVRVHYQSDMPKKIKALAYTQGQEVYIAPGQEEHLEHELGHVVQQKQGKVSPTDKRYGLPFNTDMALETEAGQIAHKAPSKGSPMFLKELPLSPDQQPIQMMSEADSVFDISKLKIQIGQIITTNLGKPGWPAQATTEPELTTYAERVQTLLEDIRQVDLQFLTATALAYDDDTRKSTNPKNKLTPDEKNTFGAGTNPDHDLAQQELYKGIILDKLEYIGKIKKSLQDRLKFKKNAYMTSVRMHGSARKPKTVKRFKKIMEAKKSDYQDDVAHDYLKDIDVQYKHLEAIVKNAGTKGYVFNQNTLLSQIDGKIQLYMAIVAPSKTDQHKDINQKDDDDKIKTKGTMLQLGVSTPVRAFSWMTKYSMDPSAGANPPPLIRTIEAEPDAMKGWHESALSEQFKEGEPDAPMNEDFKVPNQYGTKSESSAYKKLVDSQPDLTTYADTDATPETLLQDSGTIKSHDDFKKSIGFSRRKDDQQKATDVHFFDHNNTAFHEIDDKGKPRLYSPSQAQAKASEYSDKMDRFIYILGTDDYLDKAIDSTTPANGIIKIARPNEAKVREELATLLEANHCLPTGATKDLHGNSIEALNSEQEFATQHISTSTSDLKNLIDLTELRYSKWIEDLLNPTNNKNKPLTGDKLKNYRNKRIGPFLESGGLRAESQILTKSNPDLGDAFTLEYMIKSKKRIKNAFISLHRVATSETAHTLENYESNKIHVTAFCFKLLRTIMDTNTVVPNAVDAPVKEDDLFSKRVSGDYYDVLNPKDHKVVKAGTGQVNPPNVTIPFDKMTSKNRFKPKDDAPKIEQIPFMGGASGTTRDMTRDIMAQGSADKDTDHSWLKDSKDYWKFQLMNAAFMITYDYHSFVEVFYRAATTRLEYYPDDAVAKNILDYLLDVKNNKFPDIKNHDIITHISNLIARL